MDMPGYDDPVNISGEPDDVLKLLLADEVSPGADDVVEPVLGNMKDFRPIQAAP